MITSIKNLNNGSPFYLPKYPGNVYRKLSNSAAEFIRHRLNNAWVGCKIVVSPEQQVATSPEDPEPPTCLCCDRYVYQDDLCQGCFYEAAAAETAADLSLL